MSVCVSFNLPNGNRELVVMCRTYRHKYLLHRKCAQGVASLSYVHVCVPIHKAKYALRKSAHGRFHYFGYVGGIACVFNVLGTSAGTRSFSCLIPSRARGFSRFLPFERTVRSIRYYEMCIVFIMKISFSLLSNRIPSIEPLWKCKLYFGISER